MIKYILPLVFLAVLSSAEIEYRKCGVTKTKSGSFGSSELKGVRIIPENCPEDPKTKKKTCLFKKGTNITVEFDFVSDREFDHITTASYGGLGIFRVPFREIHGKDACFGLTRTSDGVEGCPVMPGEAYTHTATFPVLDNYPQVSPHVQYGINEGKHSIICFQMASKIVD